MSDQDGTDTNEDNESTSIPELREAAKKGRESAKRTAELERENAFLKAGINPDDPQLKYFVKGYEGELNAEAIKAEAEAAGFSGQTQTQATEGDHGEGEGDDVDHVSEEDRQAEKIANAVRSGANAPGQQPEVDPMNEGYSKFHERITTGGDRRQDASSEVIGRILKEGVSGNERFLAKPSAEK